MPIPLPTVFSQFDKQWSDEFVGFNTVNPFNIYNYGCLVSSIAAICVYYGHPETPLSINTKLKDVQGFVNGGDYVWGSISRVFPDVKERRVVTPSELNDAQIQEIKSAIDAGYPVIATIDYNPHTVERNDHYVIIINYDPKDENNFTIADPLGGRIVSLKEYLPLDWFKPSARKTIEQYIVYEGPVPKKETIPMDVQPSIPTTQSEVTTPAPVNETQPAPVTVDPAQNDLNIKMASQYKEVVKYLELEKPPEDAMFEDVRRVIAGIKSRQTDLENKKIEAEKQLGKMPNTIKTQEDEIAKLKLELLNKEKLHLAEVDTLKNSQPSVQKIKAAYEEAIGKLNSMLELKIKENNELRDKMVDDEVEKKHEEEIAAVSVRYNEKASGNIVTLVKSFINFFTRLEK